MADEFDIKILPGGIIKVTSPGAISAPNHMEAEKLLAAIKKAAGGKATIKHLGKKGHAHTHADGSQTHHSH